MNASVVNLQTIWDGFFDKHDPYSAGIRCKTMQPNSQVALLFTAVFISVLLMSLNFEACNVKKSSANYIRLTITIAYVIFRGGECIRSSEL